MVPGYTGWREADLFAHVGWRPSCFFYSLTESFPVFRSLRAGNWT